MYYVRIKKYQDLFIVILVRYYQHVYQLINAS